MSHTNQPTNIICYCFQRKSYCITMVNFCDAQLFKVPIPWKSRKRINEGTSHSRLSAVESRDSTGTRYRPTFSFSRAIYFGALRCLVSAGMSRPGGTEFCRCIISRINDHEIIGRRTIAVVATYYGSTSETRRRKKI